MEMKEYALARGELECIGATTLDEYRKHIEKDPALERQFQPVKVSKPFVDETIQILQGLRERYEIHHKLWYTDDVVVAAAELAYQKYIRYVHLPGVLQLVFPFLLASIWGIGDGVLMAHRSFGVVKRMGDDTKYVPKVLAKDMECDMALLSLIMRNFGKEPSHFSLGIYIVFRHLIIELFYKVFRGSSAAKRVRLVFIRCSDWFLPDNAVDLIGEVGSFFRLRHAHAGDQRDRKMDLKT
ncbi:hypothetical protein L2E82_34879 [Cichorium intybus]|uniref:Uncharacterized protein n=1 Tax=Cichorium intybus TaxID=13427 RepID=A0ACB9BMX0_CICIN|nr:hypothetical protein L2E82_34879 [Cichorium intybus]